MYYIHVHVVMLNLNKFILPLGDVVEGLVEFHRKYVCRKVCVGGWW